MANFSSIPLAGSLNPNAFYSIYGSKTPDEYEELLSQFPKRPPIDFSKLGELGQAIYASTYRDPGELILSQRLQDISARKASELSRQNIDYAVGQQRKYEKERDLERFKYGMLAGIPETISRSFGNIAATNLAGAQAVADTFAKTLANYPQAQFSQYSFQPQKYFS